MRRFALVAVLAATVAGCSGSAPTPIIVYVTPTPAPPATPSPTPVAHAVTGTFDVLGRYGTGASGNCSALGGQSDIKPGAQVRLTDGDGKVIAVGQLEQGRVTTERPGVCRFAFTLADVPEVPFYTAQVSNRGGVTKSLADMQASGWTLALELP